MAGGARSTVAPVTATREYDIILYGATGFVGKLTAEYLARAGGNARIALAGRSTDRLLAIREVPECAGSDHQGLAQLRCDLLHGKRLGACSGQFDR